MPYKPHPEKLKKRWEFQRGYKKGSKYWNRYFVIYVYNNKSNATRLGITASKKIGNSVKRNRVKRLIRESYRLSKANLLLGQDIVVVGRSPACDLKCQRAQDALLQLFRRARILKKIASTAPHE